MASPSVEAHLEAERRLRGAATAIVEGIWRSLPGYDRPDLPGWLSRVVPVVEAAQRQSVAITDAYLARALGRRPIGVDAGQLIASLRNGINTAEVYERPFVTVWTALGAGTAYEDAVAAGLARASSSAAMDVQLAMRGTATAVQSAGGAEFGFTRVANADACPFCVAIDGAYVKSADAMPLHNNCVTGDSVVWVPPGRGPEAADLGRAHAATRRRYEGEIVVLKTAAGHELTVTPNHPILTDRGWVSAGLLRESDSVVCRGDFDWVGGGVPDEQDIPARIEDRFRANPVAPLARVPFAAEEFHGDRGDGEVDVVALHSGLDSRDLAQLLEPGQHSLFTDGLWHRLELACSCSFRERFRSRWLSPHRRVSGSSAALSGGAGLATRRGAVLVAGAAQSYSRAQEVAANGVAPYTEPFGQGEDGLAIPVTLDSVREARRISWVGHVFNLVTGGGWYFANAILTHNCGCSLEPLTAPHPRAAKLPSGVAVRQHGELGPMLGDPAHDFTGPSDLN